MRSEEGNGVERDDALRADGPRDDTLSDDTPREDPLREDALREDALREDRAVYIISVAAELAGVHPQTLRIYERKGLVRPKRTSGNTRRYSDRDIEMLRQIQDLTQDRGVNLAGVKMIIEMQTELEALRRRSEELEELLRVSRRAARRASVRGGGQILPLREVFLPPWERRSPSGGGTGR